MNANTALKINDAIDQAIRCGEGREATLAQVNRALDQAERQAARAAFADAIDTARVNELTDEEIEQALHALRNVK